MAIGKDEPWYRWNRDSIISYAPSASGVYAVFKPQRWIYIGETGDIRARLLEHYGGDDPCITENAPTGFQFEAVPSARRVARQDQLILALNPACNRRLG